MSVQGEDLLAWLDAAITRAESEAGYSEGEFIFFDVGDGQIADHYQHAGSPESVLRRCAADRKLLAEHGPRSATDLSCKGCGFNNQGESMVDHYGDCPVLHNLAEGYGWTEAQR
ncbi:hypothetical protein OH810_31675 (plasmid) [Streptomyces albidoflavus]|uniref:hypothetical protein n=1 Tax=Streptomyces albidoflavus TaxID=1886 RepID=UPI002F91A6B7|nr:hypothetical protein OH810_31675 [Streptomyces albidoflavus]